MQWTTTASAGYQQPQASPSRRIRGQVFRRSRPNAHYIVGRSFVVVSGAGLCGAGLFARILAWNCRHGAVGRKPRAPAKSLQDASGGSHDNNLRRSLFLCCLCVLEAVGALVDPLTSWRLSLFTSCPVGDLSLVSSRLHPLLGNCDAHCPKCASRN